MSGMRWNDNYSVGLPKIDDEHKNIIGMINRAHDSFKETGDPHASQDLIYEMKQYATTHFLTEEKYMTEQGYPDADSHKSEHQYFIEKIKTYEVTAPSPPPSELYRFLSGWLISHIMNCDKKLGAYLIKKGVQE